MISGKLTPNFLLFGGAILLWSAAVGLSTKLAGGSLAPGGQRGTVGIDGQGADHSSAAPPATLSPELKQFKSEVDAHPEDRERRLAYADAVEESALEAKDTALLMEAVSQYQTLLGRNARDPDALRGLAHLCFETGILDKALELYPRYLSIRTDDHRARIEFALALVQGGELDRAMSEIDTALKADPKIFQAHVTRALVYKLQGRILESQKAADEAKTLAPTDEDRQRIDQFLAKMGEGGGAQSPGTQSPATGSENGGGAVELDRTQISPGEVVTSFFRKHPIVGPKVQRITWPDAATAVVAVTNFPVDQMPPFAKEKFLANVRQSLAVLPTKITVRIVDQDSNATLLEIPAGGDVSAAEAESVR